MNIVVVGHVDHGKSTLTGRLLVETGALPEGKLEQVKALCARTARPFEYAFLLDALKDEQRQGITIDAARIFFKTNKREYIIIDTPGHIEFLKNMVTGASRAEAALLVIDALEGVQENSRRHGYLLEMLGIRQVAVVVSKMDLVGYSEATFTKVASEYGAFLEKIGLKPDCFLPASGFQGDNIAVRSAAMPWYQGRTVLETLDHFTSAGQAGDLPFRMPVQDVYKFTEGGDGRRIVAGTVESGVLRPGDTVRFHPSGKESRVRTIEGFPSNGTMTEAMAGAATGFTLETQIYVQRGELAAKVGEPAPEAAARVRVSLFWLGLRPLKVGNEYVLKLGAARVPMRVERIERRIDAASLEVSQDAERVERNGVAECILRLNRPIAFDRAGGAESAGRFVVVDQYQIDGGGILREGLPEAARDDSPWILEGHCWERGDVPLRARADRYGQRPVLVLVTGPRDSLFAETAREAEKGLFGEGRLTYLIHFAPVSQSADNVEPAEDRATELKQLAETAKVMLEMGPVLFLCVHDLTPAELDALKAVVGPAHVRVVGLGDKLDPGIKWDLRLEGLSRVEAAEHVKSHLHEKGYIFRPYPSAPGSDWDI